MASLISLKQVDDKIDGKFKQLKLKENNIWTQFKAPSQ